jgi:tRNA pseudouridine55 synthase
MDFELGEVLLVNKPLRWTSFDVVNKLRYALKKRVGGKIKVGHAGTLDPLATGLLIICTGKMTKRIDEFTGMDKEYTGSFFIGGTTATYDSELEMNATFPTEHITEALLKTTAQTFIGEIEQMPPVYSAIKIDGQAAYVSARKGEDVTMKMRNVTIKEFELTKIEMPLVHFRVVCSKGTYIRSLAFDYGKALNSGAYLASLCRTKIGSFDVKDAREVDEWVKEIQTPG